MNLFDCTLRDGANVVGNGFSPELTKSMIKNLIACGIKEIEFGNAKGIGSYENGAIAPMTDLEYMKLAAPYVDRGHLGMFLLAHQANEERVCQAAEHNLHFLRVGFAAGDGAKATKAVKMVKAVGLTCRYSLMKAYLLDPRALAQEGRLLEKAGVDVITIMDSAGTMMPNEVTDYVREMKATVSIPVGFHGHNNLGLSQANALAALEAHADEIDTGMLGMARSAGNCSTELTAAMLVRLGLFPDANFYRLLTYLDTELIPAMRRYNYRVAVCPEDLILGLSGCHSSFLKLYRKVAAEEGVDVYKLIIHTSALDRKLPTEELMHRISTEIKTPQKIEA
ncbi:MAG: 4-hydroxy-2-oxovalerate aldolase [Pyramidobacter sp.]|uniref:4-hydroxy-2-oxovalerate aldolase n=1 Tax=Pyramidobacter sp. TaxID=1943581 RepID=UPI002A83ABDF|nr:4-hydroxy-2-oxovalerate aldolase [Pyramidobacter sp.]MDY4031902.1 4-hydroxy-2-oxovalerate aldolase [Pyramidobacter sp.]